MLDDLSHPGSRNIIAISREDDAILSIAKRMTLVSTIEKVELLSRAMTHISKMRRIQLGYWGESAEKSAAIDLLAKQLAELAAVESRNDFAADWRGKICTACGAEISNLEGYEDMICCSPCLNLVFTGRMAVHDAFFLWCI